MKIDCNRAALANALGIVGSVVPSRTPRPILQNVLLDATKEKAVLVGTDSEISIRHDVSDVKCDRATSVLLPARRVGEVLRELRDDRVTIFVEEKKLQLCGERSKFNIPTEDVSGFPLSQTFKDCGYFTLPGNLLKTMIRRTVFATSIDTERYAFTGVLFDPGEKLTLVGTDGRKLAMMTAPCVATGEPFSGGKLIVPAKALSLLEKTIPDTQDVIHLAFTANEVNFKTEHATITSRLVEGNFPRYKDVVPRSHNVAVDLVAGPLQGVVRQALIFTSEESRGVDFELKSGYLRLTSQAADIGASEVELPIGFDGDSTIIRLDPQFLLEFLKTLPSESQINLKLIDEDSPAVISTDDGSIYIIMPLAREV